MPLGLVAWLWQPLDPDTVDEAVRGVLRPSLSPVLGTHGQPESGRHLLSVMGKGKMARNLLKSCGLSVVPQSMIALDFGMIHQ